MMILQYIFLGCAVLGCIVLWVIERNRNEEGQ
jgi:hypothetical protein